MPPFLERPQTFRASIVAFGSRGTSFFLSSHGHSRLSPRFPEKGNACKISGFPNWTFGQENHLRIYSSKVEAVGEMSQGPALCSLLYYSAVVVTQLVHVVHSALYLVIVYDHHRLSRSLTTSFLSRMLDSRLTTFPLLGAEHNSIHHIFEKVE